MNKKLVILLSSLLVTPLFSACGHTHEYGEWKTTKVATCIQEGEEKRTCECGESETRTVNKTEHTIVKDEAKEATCLEGGKTEGSHCSICDLVVVAQEDIEALGYITYSDMQYLEPLQKTSDMMQLVLGAIGALAMMVSAINITNTMVMLHVLPAYRATLKKI